jgi:hypothetical protein
MQFLDRAAAWVARKQDDRRLRMFGGIQKCCWCRQTANQGDWSFSEWERDPFLDVLTCGICGGTSLYRFEFMMVFIGPLSPPAPAWPTVEFYDIENAQLKGGA